MGLKDIRWHSVDWIGLAQDKNKWKALVNMVMSHQFPENAGKFLSGYTTCGLLSSAQLHRQSRSQN
jgi:hypothetical protein